ncbi:hypothetical protein TNCV_3182831 [Trichonephila clavipes]|uniref:Uncharacterized protein n=1 Tax=Trichonephila clavipes TaxID=2585209 RepID=A0A8X6SDA3_TRICX|nr:hypothetical protein TNCV_3182831 [Trichonephila clavipes]
MTGITICEEQSTQVSKDLSTTG